MKQPVFTPFGPEHATVAADADAHSGERLLEGNQADLFDLTDEVRGALIGTLERALNHINLDAALLHAPGLGGDIIHCLGEQCRKGVRVQVIAHTLDMARATDELSRLCEAGMVLNEDRPQRGWRRWLDHRPLHATHRQLAVIDGEVAWCGPGIRSPDLCSFGPHVRLRGPVVQRLQRLFLEAWHASSASIRLPQANYFPPLGVAGRARMGMAVAPGDGGSMPAGHTLVEQVEKARSQVLVSMAERVPSRRLMKALLAASASGVGVSVVLGKHARGWRWQGRCDALVGVGASVFRSDDSCPFPCHAVVDGTWSSLGLDRPDARVGEGAELIVVDKAFASSLTTAFHRATARAMPLHRRAVAA